MTKFHINSKGVPALCYAQKGNCPFGGLDSHYDTLEKAQIIADKQNSENFGLLAKSNETSYETIGEISNNLQSYINEFNKKESFVITDYKDFYNEALECDTFEDFASKYADKVVKHSLFENSKDVADDAEKMWKSIHYHNSAKDLHELSDEEAVKVIRDNISPNYLNGWFREFNSGYKPKIENVLITNPELRNASLNISHRVYKEVTGNQVNFDDFLEMEIEVYRGGNFNFIKDDVFVSYSFDKNIAEKFCNRDKKDMLKRKIKIKDTLGSLQTTGEAEIMIPRYI